MSDFLSELEGLLGPKGFTSDAEAMAPWLVDWRGRYKGAAAAMLSPSSTEEVAQVVALCRDMRVPIVPQGGNTGMVGGATPQPKGDAVLLSLRRMNRIRSISGESNSAICEAGVILSNLHDAAGAVGRRFPLSLGAKGSATIGGLISTNAGGTQVLRFGTMRGLVQGIEAVLPDGSIFHGIAALKKDNRGYDLRQLLIGAEGTLGVVTAASLKLVPAIASRCVAWVGVASPHAALRLLRLLERETGEAIESFELVPRSGVELVLAHIAGTRDPLGGEHGWYVLIEAVTSDGGGDPARMLEGALQKGIEEGLVEDAVLAANEAQAEAFWRIRESMAEAERAGPPGPKHDISVEVDAMPDFLIEASEAARRRFPGATVLAFGHLGDGNVHFNVNAPAGSGSEWMEENGAAVSSFVHELVTAAGGSLSAEHGIGQSRIGDLARLLEPSRLHAMQAIKRALDPDGIMNPGKLVPLAEAPGAP